MIDRWAPRRGRRVQRAFAAALIVAALWAPPGWAQSGADLLSGFSADSDSPVQIEADSLEVRDRDRVAVFSGNVVVVQGDTTLRTPSLTVHYSGAATGADGAQAASGQSITRLEARNGVLVETSDQRATGDWAEFVMATQEVTLGGNVVLTEGDNVIRGTRLVVNLESGTSRLYASEPGRPGRVQGLFIPGTMERRQD